MTRFTRNIRKIIVFFCCLLLLGGCKKSEIVNTDGFCNKFTQTNEDVVETSEYLVYNNADEGIIIENKSTGDIQPINHDILSQELVMCSNMIACGDKVYYLETAEDMSVQLRCADLVTGENEVLYTSVGRKTNIKLFGVVLYEKFYGWSEFMDSSLQAFFLYDDKIYLVRNKKVSALSSNGEREIFNDEISTISCFRDDLYYTDDLYKLHRFNLKTENEESLEDIFAVNYVACKNGIVYSPFNDKTGLIYYDGEKHRIDGTEAAIDFCVDTDGDVYILLEDKRLLKYDCENHELSEEGTVEGNWIFVTQYNNLQVIQ